MSVKLVVRVLDADNRLLAWAPVPAQMRGDGCLWVTGVHQAPVDVAGTPAVISVHWPDLNVQFRTPIQGQPIAVGQNVPLQWTGPVMRFPTDPTPMPGVMVRAAITVAPPVGDLRGIGT